LRSHLPRLHLLRVVVAEEVEVRVPPEVLPLQVLRVEPQMLPLQQREVRASPLAVAVPARVVAEVVAAEVAEVGVVVLQRRLFHRRLRSNWWIFA
jgi:hypothetical protein